VAEEISYASSTLIDLLDAFASSDPVPGGGSASALAGAVGVSLLMMVAGNARTRTGAPEEAADLAEAAGRLRPLRDSLLDLVDQDSSAYRRVIEAMKLPRDSEADKAVRRDAIAEAMRGATAVPLDTMRVCQQALRGAVVVAANGNPNAASDTGVAVELLAAAMRGAAMNIDVNIRSLTDASLAEQVGTERRQLELDADEDVRRARAALSAP
jgi:formiminotetrahydrofolate cyclodeaminase